MTFDAMARATYDALGSVLEQIGHEYVLHDANRTEALSAMSAAAIKRATEFHFTASVMSGVAIPEALRRLGDSMLDDWQKAVEAHVLKMAARKPGEPVQ